MRILILVLPLFVMVSCSSAPKAEKTSNAVKDLDARYAEKVGKANKTELVEEFGTADWCEPKAGGGETCRFYKAMGLQWRGDKENRTKYQTFDEVVAEFDSQGVMREYKARSQR